MSSTVRLGPGHRVGTVVRIVFNDFGPVDYRLVREVAPGHFVVRRAGSFRDRLAQAVIGFRVWLGI